MTKETRPEPIPASPPQAGLEDTQQTSAKEVETNRIAPEETAGPTVSKASALPNSQQVVTIGDVHKNASVQVVERQDNIHLAQQIQTVLISDQVAMARSFSMAMADTLDPKLDAELSTLAVYDEILVAERLSILKQRRIAMIAGPSDYGKGTLALVIAHHLRKTDSSLSHATQIVESLDSQIKLNLRHLSKEPNQIANRVVIFRDAFFAGNRDVKEFFAQLNVNAVRSIGAQLEANNAYLLFTTDVDKIPRECSLAPDMIISVPPLTGPQLMKGLERRLERFAKTHESTNKEFSEKLRVLDRDLIVTLGRTMTRISQFVEWYLVDVMRGVLSVEQAFERLDTLAVWFQNDLAKDSATWSFACTLVLLQPLETGFGVPWHEFHEFHEVIRGHVLNWVDAKYPDNHVTLVTGRPISDQDLLDRSRAQITRDPSLRMDMIAFRDRNTAAKLWDSLLTSNRALMCSLVPVLENIAIDGPSPSLRGRAAQMLGRIGEIDPWRITRRLVLKWAKSKDFSQRALAGFLFQGIGASHDRPYRETGAELLQTLSDDQRTLWTAIAAYKQIGTSDLPLAMNALRELAEKHMAKRFESANENERSLLARLDRHLGSIQLSQIGFIVMFLKALSVFFQEAFDDDPADALAMQYALVSLCITNGPISFFRELRKWMGGRPGLKALVATMFLQEKGIASEIARHQEFVDTVDVGGRTKREACNPIAVAISSSNSALRIVAGMMEDVFAGYYLFFPSQTTLYLNQMFFHHIKELAKSALSVPACSAGVEDLFVRLLESMNLTLHEQMTFVLKSDAEFVSGKLKDMAESAMRRSVQV
jgi:hypothetical protein